jgi:hypothetical protein
VAKAHILSVDIAAYYTSQKVSFQDPRRPMQRRRQETKRTCNRTFYRDHIGFSREYPGSVLQNTQSLFLRQSTFLKEMGLEEFMIRFPFPCFVIIEEELLVCRFVSTRLGNLNRMVSAIDEISISINKGTYSGYWSSSGIKRIDQMVVCLVGILRSLRILRLYLGKRSRMITSGTSRRWHRCRQHREQYARVWTGMEPVIRAVGEMASSLWRTTNRVWQC